MLDLTKFKVYIVGGYVRDRLLGRECKDHDFVVVGATKQDMLDAGFNQVGADFPVFLSPSGDEYALARTERKTSAGYNGFETDFNPSITLEEDLERRDLTVNAMAREVLGWNEEGHAKLSDEIIDPFNGQPDLKRGLLRHVSEAFADDPVRVLRVARFAARYGFMVADSTVKLMQQLVDAGELDHLVPERVWTEFEKAMGEEEPSKFFWALQACGAYDVLFGELQHSIVYTGHAVRRAVVLELDTVQRLSITLSGVPFEDIEPLLIRFKAPTEVFRATRKMRLLLDVTRQESVKPTEVLDTLNKMDAFNNGKLIKTLFFTSLTCHTDRSDKVGKLLVAHKNASNVSFASLTDEQRDTLKGKAIGEAINKMRLAKIVDVWRW